MLTEFKSSNCTGPAWFCAKSSVYMFWILLPVLGTPNIGSSCVSDSFAYSCYSFSFIELPCPSHIRAFILSCFILFCSVQLLSLKRSFWRETEGQWILGRIKWQETWRSGGRGNFGQDVLYERRIYFQINREHIIITTLLKGYQQWSRPWQQWCNSQKVQTIITSF